MTAYFLRENDSRIVCGTEEDFDKLATTPRPEVFPITLGMVNADSWKEAIAHFRRINPELMYGR